MDMIDRAADGRRDTMEFIRPGRAGRGQRTAHGHRGIRRDDLPQVGGGLQRRAQLLEDLRGHELPKARRRGRSGQDVESGRSQLVVSGKTETVVRSGRPGFSSVRGICPPMWVPVHNLSLCSTRCHLQHWHWTTFIVRLDIFT